MMERNTLKESCNCSNILHDLEELPRALELVDDTIDDKGGVTLHYVDLLDFHISDFKKTVSKSCCFCNSDCYFL